MVIPILLAHCLSRNLRRNPYLAQTTVADLRAARSIGESGLIPGIRRVKLEGLLQE